MTPRRPSPSAAPAGRAPLRASRLAVAAASLTAALAGVVLPPAPPAVAEATADDVRIMPIGDSITEGADGDATWRYFLLRQLRDAGHRVDLVGTRSGVSTGVPKYTDDFDDQDHEAWSGWMADEVERRLREHGAVAAQQPDIALVHLGTNDLKRDVEEFGRSPEEAVDRTIGDLRRLVAELRAQRPGIAVVLAQIIPRRPVWYDADPDVERRAAAGLNAEIPGLAAELSTVASPVLVVDQHSGFDPAAHLRDDLHPNEAGEQRMADRWATALRPLLAGDGGTTTTTTTTTAPPTTTTAPTTTTTAPTTTTTGPPPTTTTTAPPPAADAGYWVVADDGTVWSFGGAEDLGGVPVAPGDLAVDIEATPDGRGVWVVTADGHVTARGSARDHGEPGRLLDGEAAASISSSRTGRGYVVVTSLGRALAYGDAPHHGDLEGLVLNAPVVDSVTTPTGGGYWMVAADGGVFSFGDAAFEGSMGATPLNSPVDSIVPDPDRRGYWLGAADGGVFAFEADFRGSMGGVALNRPVSGMARSGKGYLLVGADGGVFSFSGLPFVGSLGATPPARPVVSITAVR